MPATSQPTDQPTGQFITDQNALERVFREHYARLVADAKRRLGDASAAAPRVVSKAFHLAWQDRKRFHSMDELDAFLGAQIHHGAAREQSRVAGLHRMDNIAHKEQKHEHAEMTVDEAWDRLQHTLQGGAPEAYRARASSARHEAAGHVKELGKERSFKVPIIVGAVGVAIALGAFWYIDKAGESRAVDRVLAAPDARFYETGAGQQVNVTLDDGTIVRLGPESKVTIPKRFGLTGGYRAVRIQGSANFNVSRTADQPFQVRSSGAVMTATGTRFTVRRYPDDSALIMHVAEGTVDMTLGEETRKVAAGGAMAVESGKFRNASPDEISAASAWVDGNVAIPGHDLRYILPQLKRWYGLDIHVEDQALLGRQVFLSAPFDSKNAAIQSIEKSGGLKFTYIGENMAFVDTAKSKPGATKAGTKKR